MTGREDRLRQTLDALAAIGRRLASSLADDVLMFPISAADAASDDTNVAKSLDAFLQRFAQTLDHIWRKLFPRMQAAIAGSNDLLTMRELLDTLHRATVIADVRTWLELIEVRNRLTHEYALDPTERAAAINDAWSRAPVLLEQVAHARRFAVTRKLIDGNLR